MEAEGLNIRFATRSDAPRIVELIEELARFEKLSDAVRVEPADIVRDGFGRHHTFECLLAELDGVVIGFALFFPNYSTFEGHAGLYLEDIFIEEEHRGRGIGMALIKRLAVIARTRGYKRLDLSVLHWNPARSFYERLGFSELDDWRGYRLSGDALESLARNRWESS